MLRMTQYAREMITIPAFHEPVRVPLRMEEPENEFVRLSQNLGVNVIPLQFVKLAQIVRQEFLGIYPYEAVRQYLDRQVEQGRKIGSFPQRDLVLEPGQEIRDHPLSESIQFFGVQPGDSISGSCDHAAFRATDA